MCDISEIEPRNLPHPTSGLSKQVISTCVPDLSLLVPERKPQTVNLFHRTPPWKSSGFNDSPSHIHSDMTRREIQVSYNPPNINNNWESVKMSSLSPPPVPSTPSAMPKTLDKCDYSQDLRLKFYQQLQLNSASNQKEMMNPNHHLDLRRNQLELSIPNPSDFEPNYNGYINEPPLINSSRSEVFNGMTNNRNDKNHCQCNENINHLLFLIQQQNNEIHLLKTQVNSLIITVNQNINSSRSKSPKIHYETKSPQPVLNTQSELNDKYESKKASVGVMTSFEFSVNQNTPDIPLLKDIPTNYKDDKSIEIINSPKSKLEKIIERPESSNSLSKMDKFDKKKKCDDDTNVEKLIQTSNDKIIIPGNYSNENDNDSDNEVLKTTSKVGWTIYNNVLSQFNELFQGSHDIRTSKVIYDKMQTTKQLKFFESTYTSLTDAVTSDNIDQINIETSYYPRVNYQTNAMQSSNSINDSSTSIHMKALALKYLGTKNCTSDSEIQQNDNNKCWPTNNRHILDISNLKRQPKFL